MKGAYCPLETIVIVVKAILRHRVASPVRLVDRGNDGACILHRHPAGFEGADEGERRILRVFGRHDRARRDSSHGRRRQARNHRAATGSLAGAPAFIATSIDKNGILPAFAHRVFPRSVVEGKRPHRVRANIFEGVQSRYFREAVLRFDALLDRMEATLANSGWLAGETSSLADISYTPYLTRLEHLRMDALWKARPHLAG
jgi:glutathione S-transferase